MALNHDLGGSSWVFRSILWLVALFIIFTMAYKILFRKAVEKKINCLDQAASLGRASSPQSAVDKYAACIGASIEKPAGMASTQSMDTRPARCRFAGVWNATRGNVTYIVTMEADGKFLGEPGENTPSGSANITGAWSLAGNSLAWAYYSGAVWPPDVNPVSAESEKAFTLTEVNGITTRYTLVERFQSALCGK